jgi:hypothetical protein
MSDQASAKFARQLCLPEVGQGGQQALCQAERAIPLAGAAVEVEREYLMRAGVQVVAGDRAAQASFAHAPYFRHEQSSAVAEGAWRALTEIKTVLELGAER